MSRMPDRHRPHSASYLVLERGDKLLLMERKNTGFKDGKYSLVSGHVDEGENFRQAMIREAREEIGVEIEKEDLESVAVMHRNSGARIYVDVFFRTEDWSGEVENREPEKCADLSWFEKDKLPENTVDYIREVVENLERGLEYREFGW